MVVLVRFPVGKSRKLLRDGLEEANNDTDRRGLHIIAELLHSGSILEDSKRRVRGYYQGMQALNLLERGNGSQTAFPPIPPTESKQG